MMRSPESCLAHNRRFVIGFGVALALGANACAVSEPTASATVDAGPPGSGVTPPQSSEQWVRVYGSEGGDDGNTIAVGRGDQLFVGGEFQRDASFGGETLAVPGETLFRSSAVLASFSIDGEHLWSRAFGGIDATARINAIASLPSGDIVVAATASQDVDFGGGLLPGADLGTDLIVARYRSTGDHVWSRRFLRVGCRYCFQILAVDPTDHHVYVVGDSVYRVTDEPLTREPTDRGIYVVKLAGATGEPMSERRWGGDGFPEYGNAIAVGSDGSLVIGGSFTGIASFGGDALNAGADWNAFVAKHDVGGGHLWSVRIGGSGFAAAEAVAIAEDGDVVVAGWFRGTVGVDDLSVSSTGETDLFVFRLDGHSGRARWAAHLGGDGVDDTRDVVFDTSGDVMVAGGSRKPPRDGEDPFATGVRMLLGLVDGETGTVLDENIRGDCSLGGIDGLAVDRAGYTLLVGSVCGTLDLLGTEVPLSSMQLVFARLWVARPIIE